MEYLYRVRLLGQYGTIYSFVRHKDIISLAKFLNTRVEQFPNESIMSVSLVEGYDDKDNGVRVLSQHEYNIQYFYESYTTRLIQYYREQHAV